jgi:TetR/AcrR family transcriptional regulator, transcriptional repressor for nem operon
VGVDARGRLIETAGRLFHERSYRDVGIAEICREAEVTKGSLYHFFASKEDLVRAVIQERWGQISRSVLEPTLGKEGSARERLTAFFGLVAAGSAAQHAQHGKLLGCPLGNLASELSTTDPVLRGQFAETMDAFREQFRRVIADGVAAGEIPRDRDPESAALGLIALFQGSMVLGKTYGDPSLVCRTLESQAFALLGLEP